MTNTFKIDWNEEEISNLEQALIRKGNTDFKEVGRASVRSIYTRSQKQGGTPVNTNELRMSAVYADDEMGYVKDYGPHVEYGHRTKNGGFVPGQYYLKVNVDAERPLYGQALKEELNK